MKKDAAGMRPQILELGNHAKVSQILRQLAAGSDLAWYDDKVHEVARRWLRLAVQHLRIARKLSSRPKDWRAVVSRSYYAAYNISRSIRYIVNGYVKFDADDHKIVGDLPDDFPEKLSWSTFLVDLRKDRNIADYEPWVGMQSSLSNPPQISVQRVEHLMKKAKLYLQKRGLKP